MTRLPFWRREVSEGTRQVKVKISIVLISKKKKKIQSCGWTGSAVARLGWGKRVGAWPGRLRSCGIDWYLTQVQFIIYSHLCALTGRFLDIWHLRLERCSIDRDQPLANKDIIGALIHVHLITETIPGIKNVYIRKILVQQLLLLIENLDIICIFILYSGLVCGFGA